MQELLTYKAAIVGVWLAGMFVLERLLPAANPSRGWFGDWPRLLTIAGLWAVTAAVSAAIVAPGSAWAANYGIFARPAWWAGWPGLLLDLVLLDFLIYWWHRANHVVPFLWRFHVIHHLDEFLDVTSAMRFHFGEVLLSAAARAGVIVLLGFPIVSILVFEVLIQLAAMFHHSNVRLPDWLERPLSWLIITPSIHWVHHHKVQRDTDSNYGTVLSLWDRLFATKNRRPRRLDMAIGVEGRDERPLLQLFLEPFTGSRTGRRDSAARG